MVNLATPFVIGLNYINTYEFSFLKLEFDITNTQSLFVLSATLGLSGMFYDWYWCFFDRLSPGSKRQQLGSNNNWQKSKLLG